VTGKKRVGWEVFSQEARGRAAGEFPYYVPGVVAKDVKKLIFVSGQTGLRTDSKGNVLNKGNIKDQTKTVIERIKTVLAAEGATLDDIVQVNVYLKDMGDIEGQAEIRSQYFKGCPPASALVEVNLVHPDMLIEISAIAAV